MKAEILVMLGVVLMTLLSVSFGQDRDELLGIEWVVVRDAGNLPDDSAQGRGAVGYEFRISKHEITAGQWVMYLNDVDPFGLESVNSIGGGTPHILKDRTRPDGKIYYVRDGFEDYPATQGMYRRNINKFCNWLHGVNNTDQIAYDASYTRLSTARYWIPNVDEWHKAAYYQGDGIWAPYSTGSEINNQAPPGNSSSAGFSRSGPLPVGSYPTAIGHYGTFDMSGNVAEQLETNLIAGGHYGQVEFYQRASTRLAGVNGTFGMHIGFRVAAASGIRPEPETPPLFIEPAINLRWQSVNGQVYKVQSSTDMETWVDDETVLGTGGVVSLFREQDPVQRFWRVEVL